MAKSEQPEDLLSQVAKNLNKIEDKRQKSNIAACVELLAGINYSEELIKMYLHDDILKESVTYQRIIREGIAEGREQGLQQGLEQGEKSEAIALLSRQLKKRFGAVTETLKPELNTLNLEQLELLSLDAFNLVIVAGKMPAPQGL